MTTNGHTEQKSLLSAIDTSDKHIIIEHVKSGLNITQKDHTVDQSPLQYAINSHSPTSVRTLLSSYLHRIVKNNDESHIDTLVQQLVQHLYPGHPHSFVDGEVETKPIIPASDSETRMQRAIEAVRNGEFVVVVDGEDRENEGDLIIAAEKVTPEKIAFMVNETSGLICVGVTADRVQQLQLPQMVEKNTESHSTAFTVSIDYKVGTTTGISASDRSATIRALSDLSISPDDFNRPGHIFPLRAKNGGVLERPGHTEASVDLARLAGLYPAGALCEIVNKDGSMARPKNLQAWSERYGLQIISIEDIIQYRKRHNL